MNIIFTGDVCFKEQHEMDEILAKKVLSGLKPTLDSADYLVMNLETPLAREGVGAPITKSGPNIIGRPENIGCLTEAGCDLAVLANNHTADYGDDALSETVDLLDKKRIAHTGAGKNIAEAYRAVRTEICGKKFSFVGINENEFGIADENTPGTAGFDLELAGNRLAEERLVSDCVIVIFHGGNEYNPLPSPLCRERYRTLTRLGADAVIGGHTHCMQGFEYYNGKPIIYSMGNFLFKYSTEKQASWYLGYMTRLIIEDGKMQVEPLPYRSAPDGESIEPLCGDERERVLAYIEKISAYIGDTVRLREMFECWSLTVGYGYPKRFAGSGSIEELMPNVLAVLKNNLSCEAHNEVCRTAYNTVFAGRADRARALKPELDELMRMPV